MKRLRWSTAGESHGKSLIGILEGMLCGQHISQERFLLRAELLRDGERVFRERALNDAKKARRFEDEKPVT